MNKIVIYSVIGLVVFSLFATSASASTPTPAPPADQIRPDPVAQITFDQRMSIVRSVSVVGRRALASVIGLRTTDSGIIIPRGVSYGGSGISDGTLVTPF